jgi:hypothetical protein
MLCFMSRSTTRDVTTAIAIAVVPAALLLAGCGQNSATTSSETTPTVTATPTLYPEHIKPDKSACAALPFISKLSCEAEAVKDAKEQSEVNKAHNKQEQARVSRANAAPATAASSDNSSNSTYRPPRTFDAIFPLLLVAAGLAGVGVMVQSITDANAMKKLPRHRDPHGPAGAALRADAASYRVLGWVAIAAAGVPAGLIFSPGVAFFAAVVTVLVGWYVVTQWRKLTTAKAGYDIADQRWQAAALEAERAGQPVPPEPRANIRDAVLLGRTEGFEPPGGSAQAVMLDIAGKTGPIIDAWDRVSHALGLGTTDPESGRFTPFAVVEGANRVDGGDLEVIIRIDDVGKTAASLKPAIGPLLRELRVRELVGGAFTTRQQDGRIIGRFSNGGTPAPRQTAPQQPVDDGDNWDF